MFDDIVLARLAEFWGERTPWERSLWTVGTVAHLDELLEACSAGLKPGALDAFRKEIGEFIGPDVAVGDSAMRRILMETIRGNLTPNSVGWHKLATLAPQVQSGYLSRWASAIRTTPGLGAERVARYVASHLLDLGYSATHLYRWLDFVQNHRGQPPGLADLLNEAELQLARRGKQVFNVLVPVEVAPRTSATSYPRPPQWKTAPEVSKLVQAWGGSTSGLRQNGGFLLEVTAMDRFSAAAAARELIDRWNARIELATSESLSIPGRVWIENEPSAVDTSLRRRGVDVRALEREARLYADAGSDVWSLRIDDAYQLTQPAESGPRSSAIAGAWASIESLLTSDHEDDRVGAARMATIVACSFPRAELTRLARVHETKGNDQLAKELAGKPNVERSELIAAALQANRPTAVRGTGDEAAVLRMQDLLADPNTVLGRIRSYLEGSLNRLYRQRNLLLHAGLLTGDGRTRTLRSAPALVGAGLDRITHAWAREGTDPLQLAARAETNIALVGSPAGPLATRLLEP